jgi:hypothetical protein
MSALVIAKEAIAPRVPVLQDLVQGCGYVGEFSRDWTQFAAWLEKASPAAGMGRVLYQRHGRLDSGGALGKEIQCPIASGSAINASLTAFVAAGSVTCNNGAGLRTRVYKPSPPLSSLSTPRRPRCLAVQLRWPWCLAIQL